MRVDYRFWLWFTLSALLFSQCTTAKAVTFILDTCTQVSSPVGGVPALYGIYRGPGGILAYKMFPMSDIWCPVYIDVEWV